MRPRPASWLSRAPQSTRAGHRTRSRSGRTSSRTSAFAALTVSVCRAGPARKASTSSGGSAGGSEAPQRPKTSVLEQRRARHPSAVRRDLPARLEDPGDRQRVAGGSRRGRDPRGAGEHERAHRLGPADRQPQRERAAERVPHDGRRSGALVLEQQPEPIGVGVQRRRRRQRRRASVAGQIGHEQPPARQEQRREREPVRSRAPEPVHEHQRLAVARGEVAQPAAARVEEPLLEARQLRMLCVRHPGRLLFEAMDRSGRQDP